MNNKDIKKNLIKKTSLKTIYAKKIQFLKKMIKILIGIILFCFGCFIISICFNLIKDFIYEKWIATGFFSLEELFSITTVVLFFMIISLILVRIFISLIHFCLYLSNVRYIPINEKECEILEINDINMFLDIINKLIMPFGNYYYKCPKEIKDKVYTLSKTYFKADNVYFSIDEGFYIRNKFYEV